METYIKLENELLADTGYTLTQKLIISKIKGYQDNGLYCYSTQEELAQQLGLSLRTLKREIFNLKKIGKIFTQPKKLKSNKKQYKNRKAIILVDENNSLPTKEEMVHIEETQDIVVQDEIKPSNEVSKENDVVTPEKEDNPTEEVKITPREKLATKHLLHKLLDAKKELLKEGNIVDFKREIEENKFYYVNDLLQVINETIEYNEMAKNIIF